MDSALYQSSRLWTICNVFQEARNLPRCVASVEQAFVGHVGYVNHVFIDGAYKDFVSDARLSDDGTIEFAMEHGHILFRPDVSECDKRSAGIAYIDQHAQPGDWLLYIDADEEITKVTSLPERVGCFVFTRDSDGREYNRCRLYRWEPGLEFSGRHYWLLDKDGNKVASLANAPEFQHVGTGLHHDLDHDPDKRRAQHAYERILSQQEKGALV